MAAITGLLNWSSGSMIRGRRGSGDEIPTCAERGAGARQHRDADRCISIESREGGSHFQAHLVVDGVALVRPVERDPRHGVIDRDFDRAQ
jgi:hypothetical protein